MADDSTATTATETRPKRTTSFVARLKHKNPVRHDLATRIAMERENTKYWARILLLFPLAPMCVALSTVVIGGVVINAATDKCNASLMTFLQGAVVLSYVQIWFFAYCWMGPAPIKSLRTVRVFYLLYGVVCFVWWGVYGTLQATTATSSGFESCLSMSPTLYVMAQYEVAVFWVLLLVFVGFAVSESTAKLRQEKLQQWAAQRSGKKPPKVLTAEEIREQSVRAGMLEAAAERARQLEDEQRAQQAQKREQDHLYGEDGDGEDSEDGGDDGTNEEENGDEEEEELLLGESLAVQAKTHVD